LIILTISGDQHTLWSPSLSSFSIVLSLHPSYVQIFLSAPWTGPDNRLSRILNPWRYRLWRTCAGWAATAGSLSRLHQTVLGWHVVSTSNPTAAFSNRTVTSLFK
jgi:hypothetical protein